MRENSAEPPDLAVRHEQTRRDFIRTTALAAGAAVAGRARARSAEPEVGKPRIPRRVLGRTGLEVSVLSLGLGAPGDGGVDPGLVRDIVNEALDQGINYIDDAPTYGNTQQTIGPILADRRGELFIASKVEAQDRQGALAQLEQTRRQMQIDALDVAFIHNLGDFDPQHLMGPDGAFTALRQARDAGHVRFVGVSGHNRPGRFVPVVATGEVDVVMVPMNFVDRQLYAFEERVLPAAAEHGCGVVCMKVLGGVPEWNYRNIGHANLAEHYTSAVRYALSLPGVSNAVMGLCTPDELHQAIETVKTFEPLSEGELTSLLATGAEMAATWGYHYGPVEAGDR